MEKTTSFFVSPLFIKSSNKEISLGKKSLKLRDFQAELLNVFLDKESRDIVLLSAPTGAGKTLTLLVPLFANLENGWNYHGSIGIYPSRELAKDQMDSISNILKEAGAESINIADLHSKLKDDIAGEYLRAFKFKLGMEEVPILLIYITSDALKTLRDNLSVSTNKEIIEFIRDGLAEKSFRVLFTVPEYPYLLGTSVYQDSHRAGLWLYATLRDLKSFLKMSDSNNMNSLREWFRRLEERIDRRRVYGEYYVSREFVNDLATIFLLFRAPVFFDEFHLYSGFSLASFISLLYIYMSQEGIGKIIISSATPKKTILVNGKRKDLLELVEREAARRNYRYKKIESTFTSTALMEGYEQIRKKTLIRILPKQLRGKFTIGAPAYGALQRYISEILNESDWLERYKTKGRSMILVDRVASVQEAKKTVEELTGDRAYAICSVKRLFEKDVQNLRNCKLIVGNMSVAFGVDIKGMDLGVIIAKDYLSALQKIGRIGRGSGDEIAEVYLPIPFSKYIEIKNKLREIENEEVLYINKDNEQNTDFIALLKLLYPQESSDILVKRRIGIFKIVFPAWVYTLSSIIRKRDTIREKLHTSRSLEDVPIIYSFNSFLEELEKFFEIKELRKKLRNFIKADISLTPVGFYNLYSFRTIASIPIKNIKKDKNVVIIEELVNIAVAGRNIPLKVENGEFIVDTNREPYDYTTLWIGVEIENTSEIENILRMLNHKTINMRLLLELLRGRIYLFQGLKRLCPINVLLNYKDFSEMPILVLYVSEKNKGMHKFVEYLSAVESAIPIYAYEKDSYNPSRLLGGLYLL